MVTSQVLLGDRLHWVRKIINCCKTGILTGPGNHVPLAAEAGQATWDRCGHGGRELTLLRTAASGSLFGMHTRSQSPDLKHRSMACAFTGPLGDVHAHASMGSTDSKKCVTYRVRVCACTHA